MSKKKKGRLIVISGPSGVGKGTLIQRYIDSHSNVRLSVSATTRKARQNEINGVSYFFITPEEFEENISSGGMLEWAKYNNNYYGTPRAYVEKEIKAGNDVVLEIEVQGAMKVKAAAPGALLVFIMPPSFGDLLERLCGRGTEDESAVHARLSASLAEIKKAKEYDFIVTNDTVERAVAELANIIECAGKLTRYNENLIEEVYNDVKTHVDTN